jgi:hypothetical protein
MIGLASTAGERNIVHTVQRPFTYYAFRRFPGGLGGLFVVDTEKEALGFLELFFSPSQHIWQGLRRPVTSV